MGNGKECDVCRKVSCECGEVENKENLEFTPIEILLKQSGLKFNDEVSLQVATFSGDGARRGICLLVKVKGIEIPVSFNKQGALKLALDIKQKAERL